MNIYDSILTFSNDFKNCDEVKEFKNLKKKIDANEDNKKMIDDFHKKLYDYQVAKSKGEDVKEKEKKLNELNMLLMSNTDIASFMACEVKEFKNLKKKIDANEDNKKMIDDFHKKLYDYQVAKSKGEDVKEKEKKLNELNMLLMSNTDIASFMACEVRISTIVNDIVKMLEDTIK